MKVQNSVVYWVVPLAVLSVVELAVLMVGYSVGWMVEQLVDLMAAVMVVNLVATKVEYWVVWLAVSLVE